MKPKTVKESSAGKRIGKCSRKTRETAISVALTLDGCGSAEVTTGVGFVDHMLEGFARHGFFNLRVKAEGDLQIDAHHTLEDLGLTFGRALREALGERHGIARYGTAWVPMDEALAQVVIDISGRPFLAYNVPTPCFLVGGIHVRLFREFFQALVNAAGITLHINVATGEEIHHVLEAVFKAFGRALSEAVALDPRVEGVPSTKGVLD
jgi:imidazoleglycerol-phosphate dehydratase